MQDPVAVSQPASNRFRGLGAAALGIVGLVVVAWLAARVGFDELEASALEIGPVFAAVVLLELARVGCDAWMTQALVKTRLPLRALLQAHLAAHPFLLYAPAGRLAAEGVKIGWLRRHAPLPELLAAGVQNQALPLLGTFVVSLLVAALLLPTRGLDALTVAVLVQASTAIGLALVVLVAARRRGISEGLSRIARRFSRGDVETVLRAVHGELTAHRIVRGQALLAATLGKLTQWIALVWMASALGVLVLPTWATTLDRAAALFGAQLVGAAVGDVVPGQVGVLGGAFVLAAERVAVDPAQMLSMSLAIHAVQLIVSALGAIAWLVGRRGSQPI